MANMLVDRIENGTVIDHLQAGIVGKIAEILGIPKLKKRYVQADWLSSRTCPEWRKGLLKVEGYFLTEEQYDLVALLSPDATVNIIENGQVTSKHQVHIPEIIEGLIECPNPRCITRHNEFPEDGSEKEKIEYAGEVKSIFYYDPQTKKFRCHYCERDFSRKEVQLKIDYRQFG
ncbi:aspartate carbamoyltransferase regulatory subunit [Candidatus Pacearchaeota archaeon]|nr:aspartate carbamoyltransferase regulatory subunit [Candidatus Pacearchaeota archaeon]